MRRCWRTLALLAGAVTAVCSSRAGAQVQALWNSGAGNWTDAAGWSTNPKYPNEIGSTTAYSAVIFGPASDVNLDANIQVTNFTLADGRLSGDGQLNVTNSFTWSNGDLSGNGEINVYNSWVINGESSHFWAGYTVTILPNASVDWQGSFGLNSTDNEGGTVNNLGYFNDNNSNGWFWGNQRTPVFNNAGLYLKLAGTVDDNKQIQAQFNNSGQVDVQQGIIMFTGGGFNTGSFTTAPGTRLMFSDFSAVLASAGATPTTFTNASTIMSMGDLIFSHPTPGMGGFLAGATTDFAGTFDAVTTKFDTGPNGMMHFSPGALIGTNFTGDAELDSGFLVFDTGMPDGVLFNNGTIADGILDGSDNIKFQNLTWLGGTVQGAATTQLSFSGALNISGNAGKFLGGRTLSVNPFAVATIKGGSIAMAGSEIHVMRDPVFGPIGTIDLQGDVLFTNAGTVGSTATLRNDGYFKKTGGTGSAVFDGVQFINNGTVNVQSGTLRLAGGGDYAGPFIVGNTSALELAGAATHTFSATSGVTGGTLRVASGNAVLGANINVASLQLTGNSHVIVPAGAGKTLRAGSVSTDIAGGSKLDLNDNTLIVSYPAGPSTPVDAVRQQLVSAFNAGAWDGNGITTSLGDTNHGLSYIESPTSLVGPGTVTVKLALFGDANLDGSVDIGDLTALSNHWHAPGDWAGGDFDYSGFVDVNDELTLLPNWPGGIDSLNSALESLNLPPVPEPTGLLGLAATLALFRRRRRN